MLSRVRIEGRARPPRVVNPYIRAPAPTCTYDGRTSRPIPTSPPVSVRTDRGSDRPCAGLRWPRTANPASRQSLHLPSALHDAHPLWRTPKIRTVIDIEVVSQHANAADVTTAQRGVPLQALQARAPTTIRPAAVDPLTAPRVVTLGQIPAVVVRSATALRARPQTDVHFTWSSAARIRTARRGAHGLVMRRRTARYPPAPPRCRARAGRATRSGSVRAGR